MALKDMIMGSVKQENIPTVKLAVLGTSTAGKTYLLNAIHRLINGKLLLRDGLRIGALNAQDAAVKIKDIKDNILWMQRAPLPSSETKYNFSFNLFKNMDPAIHVVYHDNVGQILTEVNQKMNSLRPDFLKSISEATIVWFLLPMQTDKEGRYTGVSDEDVLIVESYLQEALQNRKSPLAFAILLTKADVLEDLEQEQSKQELYRLHTELKSRFQWFLEGDFISAAALFPISTLGFGNAQLVTDVNNTEKAEYILRSNDLKPYNVDKLLLWSLSCACYQAPTVAANSTPQIDEAVKRGIKNTLSQTDGLIFTLKDGI